jgi:hypothetical protein
MAPLIVAAIVVPVSAAFIALGPYFGFLVAGAVAVAVVLVASLLGTGPPPVWMRRRRARSGHRPSGTGDHAAVGHATHRSGRPRRSANRDRQLMRK